MYLGCLVAALAAGATWNGVQARFLAPLYVPTVAVVASLCDRFFVMTLTRSSTVAAAIGRLSRTASMIVLSAWSAGQIRPGADAITRANTSDFAIWNGYASARYADSKTLNALRLPASELPFSNARSVVALHTGARGLPHLPGSRDLAVETVFAEWLDEAPDGSLVVWLREWQPNRERFLPVPLALRVTPSFVPVGEFADGTIFEVDSPPSHSMLSPLSTYFESVVADSPDALLASDVFDLYVEQDHLWYSKEACVPGDVEERFQLTVTAPIVTDAGRTTTRNLDFDFRHYGVLSKDRCLAVVPLPVDGHNWTKFETGQRGGTTPWLVSARLDLERYRTAFRAIASEEWGAPFAMAEFDIYLRGRELGYYREPCGAADVEARFFLHLNHLPRLDSGPAGEPSRREFDFDDHGVIEDDRCLAIVPVPDGRYDELNTGQWAGRDFWQIARRLAP